MARPTKHNVDYFSHDVQMRNDIKIKALRRKYGHVGYSFWNMILEHLGDCEYFEYEWTDFNIELLSADFDVDSDDIKDMVQYCIRLELLQLQNNFLTCDNLTNRLEESVLVKRKDYSRNNSCRVLLDRVNSELTHQKEVNDRNNTESKVKESKGKKSTLYETKVKYSEVNKSIDNFSDFQFEEPSLCGSGSNTDNEFDELVKNSLGIK